VEIFDKGPWAKAGRSYSLQSRSDTATYEAGLLIFVLYLCGGQGILTLLLRKMFFQVADEIKERLKDLPNLSNRYKFMVQVLIYKLSWLATTQLSR